MAFNIQDLPVGSILRIREKDTGTVIPVLFTKTPDCKTQMVEFPQFTQPLTDEVEIVEVYPPNSKSMVMSPDQITEMAEMLRTQLDNGNIFICRATLELFGIEENRIADMEQRRKKWENPGSCYV